MKKNIALVGFMGCGKTTVGPLLAKLLGVHYIDLDHYIVKKENQTVPELFQSVGQTGFRELEYNYTKELAQQKSIVLSTGGGCLEHSATKAYLKEHYHCVFFDCPFNDLYTRIQGDQNRPLVVSNTKEQLNALYIKRLPLYREVASFTVDATLPPAEIAKEIQLNYKK